VLPLTLLALGLMQDRWKVSWLSREALHRVSWIGDISYSVYLIHFPLQLAVMVFMVRVPFAERAVIFSSPLVLLAFVAAAAGLGWLSFHYLEMPARRWLSRRMRRTVAPGAMAR